MRTKFLFILLLFSTKSIAQKDIIDFWQKGNIAAKSDYKKALKYYLKAFELAQKQKNFAWQANVLTDISGAYFGLREYQKGAENCELGLKTVKDKKLKIDSITFKLHSALAANYKTLYRVNEAKENYAIANTIIENNPKLENQIPLYAAYHFSNQGALWLKLYDIQRSRLFYEKALNVSRKIPNKSDFALILGNLSKFYFLNENYAEGISLQIDAIDFYKKSHQYNKLELAKMYFMLGIFYTKNQEFRRAKYNFDISKNLCLAEKKTSEHQYYYDWATLEIIRVSVFQKQLKEAKNSLEKLNQGELHADLLEDYWEVYGQYQAENQDYVRSLNCYFKALIIIYERPSSKDSDTDQMFVFEIKRRISAAFLKKHYQTNAISDAENSLLALQDCIKIGAFIRQNFYNVESKAYFTDKYYSIYKEALNLTFLLYQQTQKQSFLSKALTLAEESKSVVLSDKQALNTHFQNNASDSLLLQLNLYQSYLSYYKNQAEKDQKLIGEYALNINQTFEKIKYANKSLSKSYQTKNLVDITKNHKLLPEKTLYLNYIIHQNQLFLVAADNHNLYFRKSNFKVTDYDFHLKNLTHSLSTEPSLYEGFGANNSCEFFYDLLIKNIFPEINNYKRLIINPDNGFYDISFDILRDKNTRKFLIETKAITYTNNLESVMVTTAQKNKISEKWNVFLPLNDSTEVLEAGLQPLRFSFAEVKGIISDLFKNKAASKAAFLSKLQSDANRVMMIVTHAKSENDDPYLIFEGKDSKESRLYASELQFIKTQAPMVILSACETNTGKTMGGLGVLSFSKSLELSGCKAVVGSFWKVDDESLSVLASLFYQNLMAGMDKDIALQKAKLAYLESTTGKLNDLPFYWAHLQIIGNNEAIVSKFDRLTMFFAIALSLIAILVIYVFIKRAFLRKSEF